MHTPEVAVIWRPSDNNGSGSNLMCHRRQTACVCMQVLPLSLVCFHHRVHAHPLDQIDGAARFSPTPQKLAFAHRHAESSTHSGFPQSHFSSPKYAFTFLMIVLRNGHGKPTNTACRAFWQNIYLLIAFNRCHSHLSSDWYPRLACNPFFAPKPGRLASPVSFWVKRSDCSGSKPIDRQHDMATQRISSIQPSNLCYRRP